MPENFHVSDGLIEVGHQHAAGSRAGVVDRHRTRLAGRIGGQRPREVMHLRKV